MNIWVLIGIVLIILMTAFGKNPMQEAHDRMEARKQGKDPLIIATEDYLKEKDKHAYGSSPTTGTNPYGGGLTGNSYGAGPKALVIPDAPDPNAASNYYPPPPQPVANAQAKPLPQVGGMGQLPALR